MSFQVSGRFTVPVRPPAARLLARCSLRVARRRGGWQRRSSNLTLVMVPFVDFLLCVVLFLIAHASASSQCMSVRVDVPLANHVRQLAEAPVVSVTSHSILVDGVALGNVREVMDHGRTQRMEPVFDVLKNKRELWQQLNPGQTFGGRVLLRADRGKPSLVIKSLFLTLGLAGYPEVGLMVERRG
jgi:biopolymer transport protein ExbD